MSTILAVEFRFNRSRVYAAVPLNARGAVVRGAGSFKKIPGTLSDQCPGCGGDVVEEWSLYAENPGTVAREEDAFRAECACGYRTTGSVVTMS